MGGFTVPGWRFMGTVAGASRFVGAGPVEVLRQRGNVSLFQVWKAWRSKELDSLFRGKKEFSDPRCYPGSYWRPAVFVSLADKKGQVFLQLFALLVGEALHQRHKSAAAAEQLHGNWELTNQTHDSGLKSVLKETVESVLMWFRVMFLLALFTPALVVGAFINQTNGPLRRVWLHLLLRGDSGLRRVSIFSPQTLCDELSRLHMQQFHEWLANKARPKRRVSPPHSPKAGDLGAKLSAAEQKRAELQAQEHLRLARVHELRLAAKTETQLRMERA